MLARAPLVRAEVHRRGGRDALERASVQSDHLTHCGGRGSRRVVEIGCRLNVEKAAKSARTPSVEAEEATAAHGEHGAAFEWPARGNDALEAAPPPPAGSPWIKLYCTQKQRVVYRHVQNPGLEAETVAEVVIAMAVAAAPPAPPGWIKCWSQDNLVSTGAVVYRHLGSGEELGTLAEVAVANAFANTPDPGDAWEKVWTPTALGHPAGAAGYVTFRHRVTGAVASSLSETQQVDGEKGAADAEPAG